MFVDPTIIAVASHLLVAVADRVPALNVDRSCSGAAQAAVPNSDGKVPDAAEIRQNCLDKERDAREELARLWSRFSSDHRASCIRSTTAGGVPSYVELLTCLEIADQAAKLPDQPLRGTTGVTGGSGR